MKTFKFDPAQELTNSEITQILREIFGNMPQAQKDELGRTCPTFTANVVEIVEPDAIEQPNGDG